MATIKDRIYGILHIDDPFIADLLRSKPMQRLKHIRQDGACGFIDPVFTTTRYDHSVGTWYLAKRFDRPLEEQAASLLHDVPHTAFSHVADWVMGEHASQGYHDRFLEQIVRASDIPEICQKHGVSLNKVLAKEDYYLLDNHTPELSFDRWDYFMRDGFMIGAVPQGSIDLILEAARLGPKGFYFEDMRVAALLCTLSLTVSELIYQGADSYASSCLLAEALKRALELGVITEQDLFKTDNEVYAKLEAAEDKSITHYIHRLTPETHFELASKETAEFYGPNKPRFIDPRVRQGEDYVPVSQLVHGLRERIERFRESSRFTGVRQQSRGEAPR